MINCTARRTRSERSAPVPSRPSMSARSRSRVFSVAAILFIMGCSLRASGANRKPVLLLHSGRVHPKPFSSKSTPSPTAALGLAFRTTDLGQKFVAAVVMGLAISGMHYTAMWGTISTAHLPLHEAQGNASLDQTTLALAVAGITFVILAVASIVSLSERKRAEEALRSARAELAHINRVTTMGELTASLAHEVTQPIAAAATNAEACLRWLTSDHPNLEEARASALSIVKDAKRAAEIISR